jgi:FdhD protein
MKRGRSERLLVTRASIVPTSGDAGVTDGTADRRLRRCPDTLVVEEPLSIHLDDTLVTTTMRTPGHDFELAVGFCFTEGLLAGEAVDTVRYCAIGSAVETEFNTVSVSTGGRAPAPLARLGSTTSSCGWCGHAMLEQMCDRLEPLEPSPMISVDIVMGIADAVRQRQELFQRTGAVHGAAVFDEHGTIGVLREDVGRHNAVDKVIGALVLSGEMPATGRGLFVSGRASVEMVHKAWSAGFGTLVSPSAPTALAVHTARRANLVMVGFVRGGELNIYSPERP